MGFIVDEADKRDATIKQKDKLIEQKKKQKQRKKEAKHKHNYPEYVEDVKKIVPSFDSLDLREGLLWKCSCGKLFKWKKSDFSFATYEEMESIITLHHKLNKLIGDWKPVSRLFHPRIYLTYKERQ